MVRRNSKDLVCKVMYETFLPEPVQYVVGLPEAEEQQYIGGEHDHRGASSDGEEVKTGRCADYWTIRPENKGLSQGARKLIGASWRPGTEFPLLYSLEKVAALL